VDVGIAGPAWLAVELDDAAEVGGCGAERAEGQLDEARSSVRAAAGCGGARSRSSRTTLRSIPGPAAQRAAEVPGPDLDVVGQREQRSCSERKIPRAPSSLLHREVGPRDVAHEQRVAGEHRPRLVAARVSIERERGVLGPVARACAARARARAELELPAVLERLVRVARARVAVDVDRRARGGGQAAVAGHVVGVVVGLEHVLDRTPR
jgi:hypothetical protein